MDQATITLAAAYLSRNPVELNELKNVLNTIAQAVESLDKAEPTPAVAVEDSIHHDYLICLEDGKQVTLLKRHLKRNFGLDFEEYKEKWGLPDDYPSVPAKYSETRSGIAKEHGLGKVE
tara:strand:- start:2583 stop:2939 length:357 start_codon:yes stop_codon:yes gene_type:complete